MDPLNVLAKFEMSSSFTRSWDNSDWGFGTWDVTVVILSCY